MNTKIEYNEPPPRRTYAMILMLIGSTVISFGGLVIRNIDTADNWQINFYRALAFGIVISTILFLRYGRSTPRKLKGIGLQGVCAAALLAGFRVRKCAGFLDSRPKGSESGFRCFRLKTDTKSESRKNKKK